MFDVTENDPISPALHSLLELFASDLKAVKFPDMDAGVLQEAAVRVRERAEALAKAQAAMEAARLALHESQEALLQRGQRALAYVRVFAEENAELSAKLDGISLPRAARKSMRTDAPVEAQQAAANEESAPKRRGRPPKARPTAAASLFAEGGEAPAAAELEVEAIESAA
ncbi:hypothetical protein FGE12_27640 [Aggregicoccus sp. 17bor-14]|uniref:hypothetical protein n=1 Tax=Myxococcaceae TaxID=31 RepID=UPI00129CEA66|nr:MULTISPECIES: hypothetical protein [Myxococcaceae]MBF5046220.1 hypothetical protein [Simulacricoccus sp. 17bor-14]MRI91944.1 hypothetical protein [Aggregicoccus sp. 17bor-14]